MGPIATPKDVEQDADQLETADQGEYLQQIGAAVDVLEKARKRNADDDANDQDGKKNGLLRNKKEVLDGHGNADCNAGAAADEHGCQCRRKKKGQQKGKAFREISSVKTGRKEIRVIGDKSSGDDHCACLQDIGQCNDDAEQGNPGISFEHGWRELTEQEASRQSGNAKQEKIGANDIPNCRPICAVHQKVGNKQTDDGKKGSDDQIENGQKGAFLERDRLCLLAPAAPNLVSTFDTCPCDIRIHSPPIIKEGTICDKSSIFWGGKLPRAMMETIEPNDNGSARSCGSGG